MAGERDVLAEALAQHVLQSGWVRGPNAAATEARGILDLIAARGWRLVPAAPSPEPLPLDVDRLAPFLHHNQSCLSLLGYGMDGAEPIPPFREPCDCGLAAALREPDRPT